MRTTTADRTDKQYQVGAFVQACQVMRAFCKPGERLLLTDIVARSGLQKGTVFRLLYTLHQEGFIEKLPHRQYRLRISLPRKGGIRLGYSANQNDGFTQVVTESLLQAAAAAGMEVICLDNKASAGLALENAETFAAERVDLAILFFGDQSVAVPLSTTFLKANIPMVAVDVPYPAATYFGANNYRAGRIAGRYMGHWARFHWKTAIPTFLLIGYARAVPLLEARVKGMMAGIEEIWKDKNRYHFAHLDSIGDCASSYESVRKYLKNATPAHTVVGAVNDPGALGALRAFSDIGKTEPYVVMGHNAEWEARAELRRPHTKLIGSVAFFPEKYGKGLVALARKLLKGYKVPPAVVTKHVLVTPENLDRLYPNDELLMLNP